MKTVSTRLGIWCVSAALVLVVWARCSDAGGCRRRAVCYPSLPRHNYQSGVTPLRGTLATHPVVGVGIVRKVFQPLANNLTVGDCVLSQLGLVLYPNGEFVLSLRAANTAKTTEIGRAPDPSVNEGASVKQQQGIETGPVRHHRLQVRLRFYSGDVPPATRSPQQAAGALLAEYSTDFFLVTAREEQARLFDGSDTYLRDHYDEISRAEFELNVDAEFPIQGSSVWRGAGARR